MRTLIIPPADVQPDLFPRDPIERSVDGGDHHPHESEKVFQRLILEEGVTLECQVRRVNLEEEAGRRNG
ncbi:MAG: hypothetical protein M5U01_19380 [Ardenticatenaceae bacterium]|nr:hypothetical protein [Ardenticatenaceae bacterium]